MRQAGEPASEKHQTKTLLLINEARGQRASVKEIHVWPYFQT
jgi:hypothetical protein